MKRPQGKELRERLLAEALHARSEILSIRLDTHYFLALARRSPERPVFQRDLEDKIERTGRERIEKARSFYATYRRYIVENEASA